jgi:hypothetical protein
MFCIAIVVSTPETAIGVTAVTEWTEVVAGGANGLDWNVSGFDLQACDRQGGMVQRSALPEETELRVGKGVIAEFEKREGSAETRIALKRQAASGIETGPCDSATGVLVSGEKHSWRPLFGRAITLTLHPSPSRSGVPRVLELWGQITVGQTPRVGFDDMLLSGEIDLHARHERGLTAWLSRFIGEQSYVASTVTLRRGDVIVSPAASAAGRGYVRIPPADALQVGYYVNSAGITVQRAGNATVTVKLSLWSRIRNEPALSWGLAIFLFLVTASGLGPALVDSWRLSLPLLRKS